MNGRGLRRRRRRRRRRRNRHRLVSPTAEPTFATCILCSAIRHLHL
jgi:hypothetical protein